MGVRVIYICGVIWSREFVFDVCETLTSDPFMGVSKIFENEEREREVALKSSAVYVI